MNRRDFLKWMLAAAAAESVAETVDWERMLWVPKPIITVPAMPVYAPGTVGGINRSTYAFWRNQQTTGPQSSLDALMDAMEKLYAQAMPEPDAPARIYWTPIKLDQL